ncbi:MAG: MBL fold metallo-hydrolase [Acidiferrobacterales bacterium]
MSRFIVLGLFLLVPLTPTQAQVSCPAKGVHLQVLGSGGPGLTAGRASSSYLIWINGKARAMVGVGGGSALRYGESGARFSDLDFIALSRLHADHTGGLPALVRSAQQGGRKRALPIYGPAGNKFMPSTVAFIRTLFDQKRGAWRDLGEVLSPLGKQGYRLQPHDIRTSIKKGKPQLKNVKKSNPVFVGSGMRLSAAPYIHGGAPALAWRLQVNKKIIVFVGETENGSDKLPALAKGATLLVAHLSSDNKQNPRAEFKPGDYLKSAEAIGRIAQQSGARRLVISRRMPATLGHEQEIIPTIKKFFDGEIRFADDLSCFAI